MTGFGISLKELIHLRFEARTLDLLQHKKLRSTRMGGHLSHMRGRGIDFDEVRSYQAGDDIRTMDWRVTARTNQPHIKLYHEERERSVYLLIDLNTSMYFGTRVAFKSVIAAKIAALYGWAAVKHGDRVGAFIFSGNKHIEFPPRSRQRGLLEILNAVSELSYQKPSQMNADAFTAELKRVRHIAKPGSLIILISDFLNFGKESEVPLTHLVRHNDMIACAVHDPLEVEPPSANRYAISNGKNIRIIDTSDEKFCEAYRQHFQNHRDYLYTLFNKCRVNVCELATDQEILPSLQKHVRKGVRK